jgi:hypothetical protein
MNVIGGSDVRAFAGRRFDDERAMSTSAVINGCHSYHTTFPHARLRAFSAAGDITTGVRAGLAVTRVSRTK